MSDLHSYLEDNKPTEHEHDWGLWESVPHTCTEDGYYIRTCKTCSETETKNSYDPAPGHKYAVVDQKAPSCTEDGYITYQCSACSDSYTETVPAAHNWEHHHVDAIIEEKYYYECSCGLRFTTKPEWEAHADEMWESGDITHSWHPVHEKIVIEPAKDWDECTVCGATK